MQDWLLWQLLDSAFPSGSFTHSGGLEAAYQSGVVTDGPGLRGFIDAQLRNAVHAVAPFVTAAWRQPDGWSEVDRGCDLFLNNHIANRASRIQGSTLLSAMEKIFQSGSLTSMRNLARQERCPTHFAPVLGASLAILGISQRRACELLMFLTVRGAASSAVRLGLVGPLESQAIQHELSPTLTVLTEKALAVTIGAAAQTAPLLDLLQARQDQLYSRLFQS